MVKDLFIYEIIFINLEPICYQSITNLLKFIYSEKATKFCEILTLLLSVCTVDKSKVKISQNLFQNIQTLPIIYFFSVMGHGLSILNAKLHNAHLCPKLITLNAKSWLVVVPIMVPWSITYVILGTKGLGYQFYCANLMVPGPARYHLAVDSNAMISPKLIMDMWWIQIANISMVMKVA